MVINMEKIVSVIIPIYNQELYLRRALTSIVNQTYRNLEIIAVNDGSTDNSARIIKTFMEKDNRIIEITKSNGGLVNAVSVGVQASHGDFICFLDPDDYVGVNFIENFASNIGNNDFIAMGFHYNKEGQIFDGELQYDRILNRKEIDMLRTTYLQEKGNDFVSRTLHVARWNKMYTSTCIKKFINDYAGGVMKE